MTHNRITVHRVCPPNNGHNYAINLPTWVTIEHAVTNVNLTFCSFFVFFFSMSKFYIFFLFLLSFQHAHRTSSQTLILIKSMEREREKRKKRSSHAHRAIYMFDLFCFRPHFSLFCIGFIGSTFWKSSEYFTAYSFSFMSIHSTNLSLTPRTRAQQRLRKWPHRHSVCMSAHTDNASKTSSLLL